MENYARINSIKLNNVKGAVAAAKNEPVVKRLIIFGSSLRDDCDEDSDVDICLDVDCEIKDIRLHYLSVDMCKACDDNCDIFFYPYLDDALRREIDRTGEVIYER